MPARAHKSKAGNPQRWHLKYRRGKVNYEDIGYFPLLLQHDVGFSGKVYRPVEWNGSGYTLKGNYGMTRKDAVAWIREHGTKANPGKGSFARCVRAVRKRSGITDAGGVCAASKMRTAEGRRELQAARKNASWREIALVRDLVPKLKREGLVDDSGARVVEAMMRRLSMSEAEARNIIADTGKKPANGKAIADAFKRLGPRYRALLGRLADKRLATLGERENAKPPMQVSFTADKRGNEIAYRVSRQLGGLRNIRIGIDEAKLLVSTGKAIKVPYRRNEADPNPLSMRPEVRDHYVEQFAAQFFQAGRGYGTTIQSARARIKKWKKQLTQVSGEAQRTKLTKDIAFYEDAIRSYEAMKARGSKRVNPDARKTLKTVKGAANPMSDTKLARWLASKAARTHNNWVPYKRVSTEIRAYRIQSALAKRGIGSSVDQVRVKLFPKPKYVYEVMADRHDIQRLAERHLRTAQAANTKEKLPGTKAVAERMANAYREFIAILMERGGLTKPQAEKAFGALKRAKALKLDAVGGRYSVTHGAFLDKDVLQRAAKNKRKSARAAKAARASKKNLRRSTGRTKLIASIGQHGRRADIRTVGAKFQVEIPGDQAQTFDSYKAAAKYARLRLHEVANQGIESLMAAETMLGGKHSLTGKALGKLRGYLNRRNPKGAAEQAYEVFHGIPPAKILEYRETRHRHEWLWAAGTLVSMEVVSRTGTAKVTLKAPDPAKAAKKDIVMVALTEDGKQIYFMGGNQAIPLDAIAKEFGITEDDVRDQMLIGTVRRLTYQTRKNFESGGREEVNFFHDLGKEHSEGVMPKLVYRPLDPSMELVGGRYKIAPRDRQLGASPGIVG